MAIEAQLLGPPILRRDGVVYAAPRGKKVWALFAYLALAEQPPSRTLLAELLFPDAEDPASALRWNLSELRRLLGGSETVGGGITVELRLPSSSTIDVHVLLSGSSGEAVALAGLGRDLLEGVHVEASPGFAAWLLGERSRLSALSGAVLREGALRALAAGNARGAVDLATRLVGADPLDEDAHVLLVRAFAATGDETAVQEQLAASLDLFRRELGVDLSRELYRVARIEPTRTSGVASAASVRALVESGEAAVSAGAIDAGLTELQQAVATTVDPGLSARAMLALGSALVHAARGRDEDGAAMLHRAIAAAEEASDRPTQAAAHRELGYVEVLRGEYPRGQVWLGRARELADSDPLELSRVHAVTGALLADEGKHLQAADAFEEAIELCRSVAHGRQLAWSHTAYGQSQVLCDDLDEAERNLEAGLEYTRAERWTAFRSWPEALLAEVWLRTGRVELAAEAFEHAFALGCSVEDACWEAYAVRGLGLLEAAGGDLEGAIKLMEDALERCLRERDTHQWIRAYVLDALCAVGVAARDVRASAWARDLASFAGTRGMREFVVCAYLYLRDLGEIGAREAAGAIAVEVENPRLREIVAADGPRGLAELLGGPTPAGSSTR